MASNFNHNKKRNSSLVYEFMVRQMARQMIERDEAGYRRTHQIARRYFGRGTPLSKELELFNVIRASRGLPEAAARKVLQEVMLHATRMDKRVIEIKKSNLIKEVNYAFGRDFFTKHRVPEYRLLASLQLLFNAAGTTNLQERVSHILQLEEAVVRYMMAPAESPVVEGPQVDHLVLELASKKFQERYGSTLNVAQKKLLETYVRSIVTGDTTRLTTTVKAEIDRIDVVLEKSRSLNEVRADKIMGEQLTEARSKLDGLKGSVSGDVVRELMLFQKLVEELVNE